jgi:hypothetical protein
MLVISLGPIIATMAYSLMAKNESPLSLSSISPERDVFTIHYVSHFLRPFDIAIYVVSALGAAWTAINHQNRPNKGVRNLYWYIILSLMTGAVASGVYWMDRVSLLAINEISYSFAFASYVVILLMLGKIIYDDNYTKLAAATNVEDAMRTKEKTFTQQLDDAVRR